MELTHVPSLSQIPLDSIKTSFDEELGRDLTQIHDDGLFRELRRIDSAQSPHIQFQGRPLWNFSSNDYLGLANEPLLKEAAIRAVEKYGAGSGASRLISGSLAPHHELEERIAAFKGSEAALSFSTGYAAALGTICALLDKRDVIIIDKLVHASIVDAARLCGAKIRVFAHNNLNELEEILGWADRRKPSENSPSSNSSNSVVTLPGHPRRRTLIVTESVFSMDGDFAPLPEIVKLKEKFGAWLMVDEAHATGLFGANRRGLAEALGVSDRIEIQMGTLGKAVGSSGGFIAGSRALINFLVNRARSFIFSTAPVPAAAAAANAGIEVIQSGDGQARRQLLFGLIEQLELGWPGFRHNTPELRCPILPLLIGDENEAMKTAAALWGHRCFVPAIRYPTVARGKARLRFTITAAHTPEAVARLLAALAILNLRSNE
jgi:8-amino-7-oxononanoate synthase